MNPSRHTPRRRSSRAARFRRGNCRCCFCLRRVNCGGGTGGVVGACAGENRMKVPGVELLRGDSRTSKRRLHERPGGAGHCRNPPGETLPGERESAADDAPWRVMRSRESSRSSGGQARAFYGNAACIPARHIIRQSGEDTPTALPAWAYLRPVSAGDTKPSPRGLQIK